MLLQRNLHFYRRRWSPYRPLANFAAITSNTIPNWNMGRKSKWRSKNELPKILFVKTIWLRDYKAKPSKVADYHCMESGRKIITNMLNLIVKSVYIIWCIINKFYLTYINIYIHLDNVSRYPSLFTEFVYPKIWSLMRLTRRHAPASDKHTLVHVT